VPEVLRSKVAVFVELSKSNLKLKEQADALREQAEVLQKPNRIPIAVRGGAGCHGDVPGRRRNPDGHSQTEIFSRRAPAALEEYPGLRSGLGRGRADGGVQLHAVREDSTTFPVEISFSPLQTEEGIVITSRFATSANDRKSEEQIRHLNASLEARRSGTYQRPDAVQRGVGAVRLYRQPRFARTDDALCRFLRSYGEDLSRPARR